ncbi:hypothetical protein [Virgibacillus halodenitrificans]
MRTSVRTINSIAEVMPENKLIGSRARLSAGKQTNRQQVKIIRRRAN